MDLDLCISKLWAQKGLCSESIVPVWSLNLCLVFDTQWVNGVC